MKSKVCNLLHSLQFFIEAKNLLHKCIFYTELEVGIGKIFQFTFLFSSINAKHSPRINFLSIGNSLCYKH